MAKSEKLMYADQDDNGIVQDIRGYEPNGYDGEFGIVLPSIIFVGDFEEELATQTFYDVPAPMKEMEKVDAEKGQQKGIKIYHSKVQQVKHQITILQMASFGQKKILQIISGLVLTMSAHKLQQ